MKLKCEAPIIKITSVKTCRKAEFFGPDLHLPLERLEYNTHYTDTLYRLGYKARAVRSRPHESYISLHSVSHAFHFVLYGTSSWFTAYPHEERRHRARARVRARLARSSAPLSSIPSFLPLATRFPSRECISPVIFSSTVARRRERMLQRTPLTRLGRKSSRRVASRRGCFELQCGRV